VLFREQAAVPVAVHEAKNGRNAVPSRPLQAPGMLISTAEYSLVGKRTQLSGGPSVLFREQAAVPVAVHEAKNRRYAVPSRPLQAPGGPTSTAEYFHIG
jgi:hypothetical protein